MTKCWYANIRHYLHACVGWYYINICQHYEWRKLQLLHAFQEVYVWVVKWIIRYKLVFADAEGTFAAFCVYVGWSFIYRFRVLRCSNAASLGNSSPRAANTVLGCLQCSLIFVIDMCWISPPPHLLLSARGEESPTCSTWSRWPVNTRCPDQIYFEQDRILLSFIRNIA